MTYAELYEELRSATHAAEIGSAAAEIAPGSWVSTKSDGPRPVTVSMQLVEDGGVFRLTVSVAGIGAGSTRLRVSTCDAEGRRHETSTAPGGRASLELEALALPLVAGIGSQAALNFSEDPLKQRLADEEHEVSEPVVFALAAASHSIATREYVDDLVSGTFRLYGGDDEQGEGEGEQPGIISIELHKSRTDIPETAVEAVDRSMRSAIGSFDESGVARFEIASDDIDGLTVRLLLESP